VNVAAASRCAFGQDGAVNYERLAAELVRAVRGKRSAMAVSRRLGFRSNVVNAWESQRAFPSAAQFYTLIERLSGRARASVQHFYQRSPDWLDQSEPWAPAGVARMLEDLSANRSILEIAGAMGKSRFVVGRWLKAQTEPRLPEFLQLIEVLSYRLLDFLEGFTEPSRLPAVGEAWNRLQLARRAAYEVPWSHAVLRVLELEDYQRLPRHRNGFIAKRLGITREQEQEALSVLEQSGQIQRISGRYELVQALVVDTRRDRASAQRVRQFWASVVTHRLRAEPETPFAYNLFAVSRADLLRIRDLERAFFRDLRSIVAASTPSETVALVTLAHLEFSPKS